MAFTDPGKVTLRGTLVLRDGKPALEAPKGRFTLLSGDAPTTLVLNDARLAGVDLEVIGHQTAPGEFTVDPIHTKAMFVHKDGKRLFITYWCDTCSIRTYSPGKCYCCQQETALDLRDNLDQ